MLERPRCLSMLYSLIERTQDIRVEIRRRPINIITGYFLVDFLIKLFYHSFCVFTAPNGKRYCLEYNSNESGILHKPLVTIMLTEYKGDDNSKIIDSGIVPCLYNVISQLSNKYKPGTYFFLSRNCQHFTNDVRSHFNHDTNKSFIRRNIEKLYYLLAISSILLFFNFLFK